MADIFDAMPMPKDDLASMEHPMFALRAGDRRVRHYEHNGITVEVQPGVKGGLATIHDKDILIYCISRAVEALNSGLNACRIVRFTAYDFLVNTNRQTSGQGYKLMADALNRLRGTQIITNIEIEGYRERSGFGMIDSWRIIERSKENDQMVAVEVELSRWLWRAVETRKVLTISRDYFRLRKPLDRRIYELVRKHCGKQPKWQVSLGILHRKSGSTASLREFRRAVKSLAESGEIPDYIMRFNQKTDTLTFYAKGPKGSQAQVREILKQTRHFTHDPSQKHTLLQLVKSGFFPLTRARLT